MLLRAMTTTGAGLAATLVLIYAMHLLIEMGENVEWTRREPIRLAPFLAPENPDTPLLDDMPVPIPDPVAPPERRPAADSLGAGEPVGVRIPEPPRPDNDFGIERIGMADGPLVNVIKVQPQYPIAAITRGLEGTVLVRFDVTAAGAVTNVVVLESSHRVFEKAAVAAAHRFRYKPRVVDGVPQGATGLKQLFTFELEK